MNIYEDISKRTKGEIYIGVVGPVRCGKSTFIKGFIDNLILPRIEGEYDKERARDITPQSASGRTIMTTEPKFVPDEAVNIRLGEAEMSVRLIDCVGYMVDGAIGGEEEGKTRMVMTPWQSEPMEFETAAELGTKKVICEHSTVGIVVTCDSSFGEIPRSAYIPAEEKVIGELKALNKPFVIVLNSSNPQSKSAQELAMSLEEKYDAPVALVNALMLENEDFEGIFELLLGQFNIKELRFKLPEYITALDSEHWLRRSVMDSVKAFIKNTNKIDDIKRNLSVFSENESILGEPKISSDLGNGTADIYISLKPELFYSTMSEICGIKIEGEGQLFETIKMLADSKREYDKFVDAIDEVNETGYGIVLPNVEDMTLEEPEMVKQSGAYGVRLKASAPSIHLIRASIETEINPVVGTQEQSEEIVKYMLEEFEDDPKRIWESNLFGKSLYDLVNEGLHAKLEHISQESRLKLSDTLTRVINEGSNGLICILL